MRPPTGQFVTVLTDTVIIGEDAAGGGTDLDASREYSLQGVLSADTLHPQQSYHVKLEVDAPFSLGADNRFEVSGSSRASSGYGS